MKPSYRHNARELALQALYQWQLAGTEPTVIEAQFHEDHSFKKVDADYFHTLLFGVIQALNEIDASFAHFLDRAEKALGPVELSLLRLGAFELMYQPDVPYKVVLNEAIGLAKDYGAEESFKYVNAVLDQVAKKIRALEQPPSL